MRLGSLTTDNHVRALEHDILMQPLMAIVENGHPLLGGDPTAAR
jgi:hypothetical protein